jgi:phosphoribosylformylglycinamidine cyclo-ligase
MLNHVYATPYPESFSPETEIQYVYSGPWKVDDEIDIHGQKIHAGKLLLSPTRTYLPILRSVIREYRQGIQGIIHCTGGAFTKVLKFVSPGLTIQLNQLPPAPKVFELIHQASGASLEEMYKVFNMGVRMMLFVDKKSVDPIISLASSFGLGVTVLGEVHASEGPAQVHIHSGGAEKKAITYSN